MKLKTILVATACLACAASLTACAGLGIGGGGTDWAKAAVEIAKDPACTHTDVLDVMLGAVPSGHIHLERSGCKTGAPAKTVPSLQTGTVVAPVTPPAADTTAPHP